MPIRLRNVLCALPLLLALSLPACALTGLLPQGPIASPFGTRASTPESSVSSPGSLAGPAVGSSTRPETGLEAARRHWRNGDLASALTLYREIVAGGETSPQVLLELGQVELKTGQTAAARQTFARLAASAPGEPLQQRAALLLAAADLALGNWESVLEETDVAGAPDGLSDLVILYRAEAMIKGGKLEQAKLELGRKALTESTNRLLLERAGQLAEQAGDPGLAGDLYLRGSSYPGWTAERSRMIGAAAAAFDRAGLESQAIDQYRRLVETYTWTKMAQQAGERLVQLGGLTAYDHGLLDLNYRSQEEARAALEVAAAAGPDAAAAQKLLAQIEEGTAWRQAVDAATAEAFLSFRSHYPNGEMADEAWFREGLAHYTAGRLTAALDVWTQATRAATGNNRARLLLWMGKTLAQLGRDAEGRARLQEAAGTSPAGYYARRARDLLAGTLGWPGAEAGPTTATAGEQRPMDLPPDQSPGPGAPAPSDADKRVGRGLGFLALGLRAEAAAEMDALISESQDPGFLLRLAEDLTAQELWSSAARAAARVAVLSPTKAIADAPLAVRRLAYPAAYWDMVCTQSKRNRLDPLLLMALIHQESLHDPYALSVADARGLTQVIPSTGRGIASALGQQDFTPDDLYRPAVAIEFGARYLGDQLKKFGGDPFLAVAAYNAGPGPVPRWAVSDPDLFVERIDYAQTRDYVRQIYVHYDIYRSLGIEQTCPSFDH